MERRSGEGGGETPKSHQHIGKIRENVLLLLVNFRTNTSAREMSCCSTRPPKENSSREGRRNFPLFSFAILRFSFATRFSEQFSYFKNQNYFSYTIKITRHTSGKFFQTRGNCHTLSLNFPIRDFHFSQHHRINTPLGVFLDFSFDFLLIF